MSWRKGLAALGTARFWVAFWLGASAAPAYGWKVTTHMVAATKGIEQVADPDLRAQLQANVPAVRAGSVGPDLFYFPFVLDYPGPIGTHEGFPVSYLQNLVFSDMAHYCKTDQLAKNMISLAAGDPALRAFGHGWFAHNV